MKTLCVHWPSTYEWRRDFQTTKNSFDRSPNQRGKGIGNLFDPPGCVGWITPQITSCPSTSFNFLIFKMKFSFISDKGFSLPFWIALNKKKSQKCNMVELLRHLPLLVLSSSLLSLKKKETKVCIDYRPRNLKTKPDCLALPNMEEIWEDLNVCSYFTILDLFLGYWQIRVVRYFKDMTTFTSRFGNFSFLVMPFGPMNALATYQRMMNEMLQVLPYALVKTFIMVIV